MVFTLSDQSTIICQWSVCFLLWIILKSNWEAWTKDLFSSVPHSTSPEFAGKWTKKIWGPSTWLGCCAPRKGLWNLYWETSPRPFWGWTYTIMWKSESMFRFASIAREKHYCLHFAFMLIFPRQWWCLPIAIPQADKTFLPAGDGLSSYPFIDSMTLAANDIIANDHQICISYPGLHRHAISLQTPCAYQYRLTP